jgi:hypothetical protein
MSISDDAMRYTVEITKSALATHNQNGSTWIQGPDQVAKFVEVVSAKINELMGFASR